MRKILLLMAIILLVSTPLIYGLSVNIPSSTVYISNISNNRSDFWDNLDDPSEINITDLGDVNTGIPSDEDFLRWDDTAKEWISEAVAGISDTNDSLVIFNSNASWLSTYNATYDTGSNASWNQTKGNSLYTNQTYVDSTNNSLATWVNSNYGGGNASWNQSKADGLYIANDTQGWYLNITKLWTTMFHTLTSNFEWTVTDDGSNIFMDFSAIGGTNSLFIETAGTFIEIIANPGPTNDYEMIAFEETQGDDTSINFYEGGVGHNRIWSSGSVRVGGGKQSVCSNLTSVVDCDTSATGADLVVEDDIWLGGEIFVTNWTNLTNEFNASWTSTYNATYDVGSNASWNQTKGNTLYTNQTYVDSTNDSLATWVNANYGGSNASWTQLKADELYIAVGNLSIYNGLISNASYLSTYNATYDAGSNASWNQTKGNTLYTNQTYVDSTNDSLATWVTSNFGGANASWNQSKASGLYIAVGNQSIYDGLISNSSYLSTYNATYDAGSNASWNQTKGDNLYASIGSSNQTLVYCGNITGNATDLCTITASGGDTWLVNYSDYYNKTDIDTNFSLYVLLTSLWDSTFNSTLDTRTTQYTNDTNNSLASWVTNNFGGANASFNQSLTDELYTNQTYVDSTNDSLATWVNSNFGGANASWNQTKADGLYTNQTYVDNTNSTLATWVDSLFLRITEIWDSAFNATLDTRTTQYTNDTNNSLATWVNANYGGSNASWTQLKADELYIATGNQSIYDGLISNASYLSTYNATYDAKMDYNATLNLNMSHNNVTSVDCITFQSGGRICSGS